MAPGPGGPGCRRAVDIGVVKEIKPYENRVAVTPAGVRALVRAGHRVFVEAGAGQGSGFADEEYAGAGAEVLPQALDVFAAAEMIVKVKEPLPQEYGLFREGQILFTYLHLAPEPELTRMLMERRVVAIAYETVQLEDRSLPLLTPMSEVAGRMAVQIGAHFLEKHSGGRGVLLGGVPGVPPGRVVIVGGGTVGTNAAKMAVGLGAHVTILDINADRLRYLDDIFGGRVETVYSNEGNIGAAVERADLVIGAVLIPGARAPKLVTEEMVRSMQPGSVLVDVAIDQGGSIATMDRTTTHADPVFERHGVLHYAVPNMPGAVPRTSTLALTGVTLPYVLKIAGRGWRQALREDPALARGANVVEGRVVHEAVAQAHGLAYTPLAEVLG
ncbi:alanine dehydrogenase [Caldinitratiruptor microaerophilus]|uniref:Alanine dehydrogenase n=1 Tax=Caldinitratiruptor microaerophilus TaxID=671077 RepID=A0AA35CMA4_9FIRM|nr:alanine dehydrogenase [Caldinitratiruptor microaerophilus]